MVLKGLCLYLLTNKKILTGKAGQQGWINPLHPVHVCPVLIFIQKVILCHEFEYGMHGTFMSHWQPLILKELGLSFIAS